MKNSIRRMSFVIIVVAFSVATFSHPASAQFYFGAKGTAFLPNSSEDGLKNFDTGHGLGAFTGYRFMPNFGLEAGAGYYKSESFESNIDGSGSDLKRAVITIPLTLTAKGFLPLGDKARLYAGAGVGMYLAVASNRLGNGWAYYHDDQSAFGYHAVVGGEFMVFKRIGLQAEAKWFKVEPEFDEATWLVEPEITDEIVHGKIDIGGVMLSLGIIFQL